MNVEERILELANQYLDSHRPVGPNDLLSLCPFHSEREPSFTISKRTGLYICFSCGAKGNLRSLLVGLGVEPEVIHRKYGRLIDEARENIPLPPRPFVPTEADKISPLPDHVLGLFDFIPETLLEEGFKEGTLKFFEVGVDKTHNRITYPLRDLRGRLIGISGRTLINHPARYKTYDKEYLKWDLPERGMPKSNLLWNGHNVYPELYFGGGSGWLVLVEGFKACMKIWQAGVKSVTALMGIHLSAEQKWIIQRFKGPIILMFDNNPAGVKATVEIGELLARSTTVKVALYEAEQPDGLSDENALDAINSAVEFQTLIHT